MSPASAYWFRAQVARARQSGQRFTQGRALILSPHPDDETIACGLLLAGRARRGLVTDVAVATDGAQGWFDPGQPAPDADAIVEIRRTEWHRGLDRLGVDPGARHEFGFADKSLTASEDALVARIADLIEGLGPDLVLATAPDDLHADHRALGRAAARAVAARAVDPPSLVAYRVYPAAGLWNRDDLGDVNPALSAAVALRALPRLLDDRALAYVDQESLAAKRAAIDEHVSQRALLRGELQQVWSIATELYRPLDPLTLARQN